MLLFTIKRLVSAVVLMFVVATATFFLARVANPDPVASLFGQVGFTQEEYEAKRQALGLDRPLLTQYWDWISHAVRGDFGNTWVGAPTPISHELAIRLPVTLSVVIYGLILMIVVGSALGTIAGIRPGSLWDRVISWSSVIFFAMPGFLIGVVLIYVFAIDLGWFPTSTYFKPERYGVGKWIWSITLPAVAVALGGVVMIAVQLRNAIVTANASDYVRTLRARGLGNGSLAIHLLRNAAPPTLTIVALMFVGMLSGTIVIESMFNFPGIGKATQEASQAGNLPMILALTCISVLVVVIVNFLLDLVLGWVNPKARIK